MSATVVWLRRDLRLADHPALAEAAVRGMPVVVLFVWAPDEEGSWAPGAASRVWLDRSLRELAGALQGLGSRLVVRAGADSARAVAEVAAEAGADAVHWNRRYEPAAAALDAAVEADLRRRGLAVRTFHGDLLAEPGTVLTAAGTPPRVFTPFWKRLRGLGDPPRPSPAPVRLAAPARWPASEPIDALRLRPAVGWDDGIAAAWRFGEAGAAAELEAFLDGALERYAGDRDRPGAGGVSRLSPHLHFGEIGPRQVWWAAREAAGAEIAEPFLRQLAWRDFAHHLLAHRPDTPERPLDRRFERFPWRDDPAGLRAWSRGRTGYPLVDAGMRELWRTGWMHNRVRMVAASFLVKHLLVHWREGAAWFWDTLVDADLANNTLGWQWVAGCGADAAPYFRIFNPVAQGERFDPAGRYVRRWVPELARLPERWLHRPWAAPGAVLARAGVRPGRDYPEPIVDHGHARRRALDAYATLPGR